MLELAGALGLRTTAWQRLYHVCIVGGGPVGLVAAVSEGPTTVIVDREAPGCQAGQSAAIENYLGFPKGLTGSDLAQRAIARVSRFGVEMILARDVVGFEARGQARRHRPGPLPLEDTRLKRLPGTTKHRRPRFLGIRRMRGQPP